jgi:hypothetical protein
MNLTIDQYVDGLESSARSLPGVLAGWDELDPELCYEYVDQLEWLLRSRTEVLARATAEGRYMELAQRIVTATSAMFHLRDEVREKMGIPTDRIVPYVTYVATGEPDSTMSMAI